MQLWITLTASFPVWPAAPGRPPLTRPGTRRAGAVRLDLVRTIPYHRNIKIGSRSPTTRNIQEQQATLTSKGQITLPKFVRQALGVGTGSKVTFELRGDEIVVTRAEAEHEDPAIGAFLNLLARDIEAGRHVRDLPEDLARAALEHAGHKVILGEEFDDDVEL